MSVKLAENATLADVISLLHDPVAYLLRVKSKLAQCSAQHGNASVRIGRTGGGQYPCFRILYNDSGVENVFGAFIDTGKPYPTKNLSSVAWSSAATDYADFKELLLNFQNTHRT